MVKRTKCYSPKILFFLMLIVGLFMLFLSLRMPKYSETKEYEVLNEKYYNGEISEEKYYEELYDNINPIMDIGNGLIVSSAFILLFLYVKRINRWHDFLKLKAMKKVGIVCLSNIMLLLEIAGSFLYYGIRLSRGYYPPFSDSIGIPISITMNMCVLGIIPLNVFLFLALRKSDLKTSLLLKHAKYKGYIIWECLFCLFLSLQIIRLVTSVIDGDHSSIVISMVFIYILLSLRAGKIHHYRIYGNL